MSSDNKELLVSGIERTKQWFEQAIPNPTIEQACVQIGCSYEETSELANTLGDGIVSSILSDNADCYKEKHQDLVFDLEVRLKSESARIQMLDDIVDEIVTRIGIAHNIGLDIIGALEEVNRSNFSKFENGKPVFDENGKITKGRDYTPPNLKPYI